MIDFLRDTFVQRSRDEWDAWFADKDVAYAPVLNFRDALDAPHVAERGMWVNAGGGHQIAPAIRFRHEDAWSAREAPTLDEYSKDM